VRRRWPKKSLTAHVLSGAFASTTREMATETAELKAKFATLVPTLDDLEALLQPLLDQPLPDTLAGLDTIQQAKLYALIPYLVYDLAFGAFDPQ
jgi:hypothetical protein